MEPVVVGAALVVGVVGFVGLCLGVRRAVEGRMNRLHDQDARVPARLWCRGAFGMITTDSCDYAYFDLMSVYPMLQSDWGINKQPDLERLVDQLEQGEDGAWDLVRAMLLARSAVAVGWWTADKSWQRCYWLGKALQSRYPNWQAMADDLLRSRQEWSQGEGMQRVQNQVAAMREQIWSKAPWTTPLAE